MEFKIEIPDEVLENVKNLSDGFKIPIERVLAIMAVDWIGRMDAEIQRFGKPATAGCRAFDHQFTDDTPEGFTIESSYELSRSAWALEFLEHSDFYQARSDALQEEDDAVSAAPGEEVE